MRFLFLKLYLLLTAWYIAVKLFLLGRNEMNGKLIQSGELVVVEKGEIRISLGHKEPCEIEVRFLNRVIIPCNSIQDFDELTWEIIKHNHEDDKYQLIIKWDVSEVRTIVWFSLR